MARYLIGGFAASLGNMDYSMFGFDPINLNTGNFIYEKEVLVIHGITTLSFHITYNSMEEYSCGSLGEGWHHNYEIYIADQKDGRLDLHLGDGQVQPYHKIIGNIYTSLHMMKEETFLVLRIYRPTQLNNIHRNRDAWN